MQDWHEININGNKKKVFNNPNKKKSRYSYEEKNANVNGRACLISGPPGIGKTSLVSIMANHLGYESMFINASDKRSKKVIETMLKDLCQSATVDHYFKMNKSFTK